MRFLLTFQRTGKQRMLPADYQYFLASWVYRVISKGDAGFSAFLHNGGYRDGNKQHKLFCLSPLNLYPYKLWKEKRLFELQGDRLTMELGFMVDRAASEFIKGLFLEQQFYLGDRFNGIDLTVISVEALNQPVFTEKMQYRALSPVTLSRKQQNSKHPLYLSPSSHEYARYFLKNLAEKQKGARLALDQTTEANFDHSREWDFRLLNRPRSRLYVMKPYTQEETKVRGFLFDFELTAPVEIHELMYYAGAGEKGAMGWGFCGMLK